MTTSFAMELSPELKTLYDDMVLWRRHIHAHPEVGLECHRTAAMVADHLTDLGMKNIRTGVGESGVVVDIPGSGGDDRVLLLRADMDALPMQEEARVPYQSTIPGVMHACGHDAHTAILMGVATLLSRRKHPFPGTVRLMFQPGEEGHNGAMRMIRDGAMDSPVPTASLGLHVWNEMPVGTVYAEAGPVMASADMFSFTIHGKGGHGAIPHFSIDPIVVAAQVINQLQTIVSRSVDPQQPAVVTIGTIQAGTAPNIIPASVECSGTIRSFDPAVRDRMIDDMQRILKGICDAADARYEFSLTEGYPATVNDPQMTDLVRRSVADVMGESALVQHRPTMGAEDMSYILQRAPGAFFFVGSGPEGKEAFPHHHPEFDIDERVMAYGAAIFMKAVERFFYSP